MPNTPGASKQKAFTPFHIYNFAQTGRSEKCGGCGRAKSVEGWEGWEGWEGEGLKAGDDVHPNLIINCFFFFQFFVVILKEAESATPHQHPIHNDI